MYTSTKKASQHQLGGPHIYNLTDADRDQVLNCIRDKTGMYLTKDGFVRYDARSHLVPFRQTSSRAT